MDKIHTIIIDENFDVKLQEFQDNLKEGEQIVSQSTVTNKFIIVTREARRERRNLLLEEHSK
jgi:hypothetical protein